MKLHCRSRSGAARACAPSAVTRGAALAADYPDRPIHWVVPYPPAAPPTSSRAMSRRRSRRYSANRSWSTIAPVPAASWRWTRSQRPIPDGYTLLVSDASLATAPSLYKQLPFDPVKDLQPSRCSRPFRISSWSIPRSQANSLGELIALSKKTPASSISDRAAIGSPLHLAGEALRLETGISWTHVPYKGAGPAIVAAISNEVQVATPSLPAALAVRAGGKLRALAVMSPKRLAALPDVPTVAELGFPKATVQGWVGLHAPAGTPPAVLSTFEAAVTKALQVPNCAPSGRAGRRRRSAVQRRLCAVCFGRSSPALEAGRASRRYSAAIAHVQYARSRRNERCGYRRRLMQ